MIPQSGVKVIAVPYRKRDISKRCYNDRGSHREKKNPSGVTVTAVPMEKLIYQSGVTPTALPVKKMIPRLNAVTQHRNHRNEAKN